MKSRVYFACKITKSILECLLQIFTALRVEGDFSISEEETPPDFNKQGYSGKGKNITTKHDAVICGRKNASKIMEVSMKIQNLACSCMVLHCTEPFIITIPSSGYDQQYSKGCRTLSQSCGTTMPNLSNLSHFPEDKYEILIYLSWDK